MESVSLCTAPTSWFTSLSLSLSLIVQPEVPVKNPVLDVPESVLVEEEQPVAMVTGGDDEEGAISDPGSEMLEGGSDKFKVQIIM